MADYRYLASKRQKKIVEIVYAERRDAAINAVVIGLKALNHVYRFGLVSLSALSAAWHQAIDDFYKADKGNHEPQTETYAGEPKSDIVTPFLDLSASANRRIRQDVDNERRDAQYYAVTIGCQTIRKQFGFGVVRMERLMKQWERDIAEFYEDRETAEPLLTAWIEDIGFVYRNGKLMSYRDTADRPIKKRTAERLIQEGRVED